MKNQKGLAPIIIVLIVLIIVIGFGLGGWLILKTRQPKPLVEISEEKINNAIKVCEKIQNNERGAACIGIAKSEPRACDVLPEPDCYIYLALRISNSSFCEKSKYKYECLALLTEDYKECKNSGFDKDVCYLRTAIKKRDSLGCKYITTEFLLNQCLATVERNPNYCIYIEQPIVERDSCYIKVATLTGDSFICQKIDERRRNLCVAMIETNKEDINCGECDWCCWIFAVLTKDFSVCEKLPSRYGMEIVYRDNCYFAVAMRLLEVLPPELLID